MLLGGWRSLRQHDIKLLLAYGTVSQLGFLMVVLRHRHPGRGAGRRGHADRPRAVQGDAVPGRRDHRPPGRHPRPARAVRRRPVDPGAGRQRAARRRSMAGLPPLAGFVAKESVFGALIDVAPARRRHGARGARRLDRADRRWSSARRSPSRTRRVPLGHVRDQARHGPHRVRPRPRAGFLAAPVLLAASSLVLGFLGGAETTMLEPYAEQLPRRPGTTPSWRLWHGLGPAAGAVGHLLWPSACCCSGAGGRSAALQAALSPAVERRTRLLQRLMRLLDRAAVEVTGLTQRGSLPIYLGVILLGRRAPARARRCSPPADGRLEVVGAGTTPGSWWWR